MDAALQAGIAIYNAGEYHAAHDAWEDHWLDLESGTDDELLLHGLIQFTAAVYHLTRQNWTGGRRLAESAGEYLDGLPADYRGVDLDGVRTYLAELAADPERIERRSPLPIRYEGAKLTLDDLEFDAASRAALVLADEYDEYDEDRLERAVALAREELDEGVRTKFVSLVMDFATDATNRDLIYQRLGEHLDRVAHEEEDVEGLFDE